MKAAFGPSLGWSAYTDFTCINLSGMILFWIARKWGHLTPGCMREVYGSVLDFATLNLKTLNRKHHRRCFRQAEGRQHAPVRTALHPCTEASGL